MNLLKPLLLIGVVLLLSGCAWKNELPEAPEERLASVKAMTQRSEKKVLGLIPEYAIEDVRQLEQGTLLRCGIGYQWTRNVRVELSSGADAGVVRDHIARGAANEGFTVAADKTITGNMRFEIVDAQGVHLLLTKWVEGNAIDVDSGSPCFALPHDFDVP